jgi:UDP-glucose 4-epimerase
MIVITGGLGFIGSHLVKRIYDFTNDDIQIIDNCTSGARSNLGDDVFDNITIDGDMSCIDKDASIILHLGMPSSSPMYKGNPHLLSTVVDDMISILNVCAKNDAPLVYASTSSIYNGNKTPWTETMPVYVSDYYTEGRYIIERLAELYNKMYHVQSVGLRFFSVYGPHELAKGKYANLVSQFMWDIHDDKQPVIYGDGTQARDFVYVDDVIDAIIDAGKYADIFNESAIFNVGTGISHNLNDTVRILNDLMDKKIKPKYVENKIANYVPTTLADCTNSTKCLGWKSKTKFIEGINKTYSWYLNHIP